MPKLEMTLHDYWRVVRKRLWIVFFCAVSVFGASVFFTSLKTPIYTASSKVKVEQRKSVAALLTEVITWSPGDTMDSEARMVCSYRIMEPVAKKLGLLKKDLSKEDTYAIIRSLEAKVRGEQIGNTNIIEIVATSDSAQETMDIANTTAEVYAEEHFKVKKEEATNVRMFVEEQMKIYERELSGDEIKLRTFMQENPFVQQIDLDKTISSIQDDPVINQLKTEIANQQVEMLFLRETYTDEFPKVKSLKEKIETANKALGEQTELTVARHKDLSGKEIELVKLKRNITLNEDIYMMFKKRYEETRILEAEKAMDVTVIEWASKPMFPISPDKKTNAVVGMVLGLILGVILAFVKESLDTSIGTIEDVEESLKLPVLGIIPHIPGAGEKGLSEKLQSKKFFWKKYKRGLTTSSTVNLSVLHDPRSSVSEAFRTLRTNIEFLCLKKAGNSILVTSATLAEGKTTCISNLAITIAQSGKKVLLVEANLRRPTLYKKFGLSKEPGLTDVLIEKVKWEEAVRKTADIIMGKIGIDEVMKAPRIENLNILTCGYTPPNPTELLASPMMDDLIAKFKDKFEVLLFDCPPVLPVTDAAILGAKVDGVVLVYEVGRTPRQAIQQAKTRLEHVNAKVLGIVLNNVKHAVDIGPIYYGRYK